ncbi:plasma kallikrein-like [Ambystoma mexicanum]|uniref:plasma kallikrein-like n=1 Tax=Ambystoma mexicanum TaxID=8296 RepID=UPI0037E80253
MWTAAIPCLLLAFLSRTISGDLLPNVAFPGNDVERISVPDPEYCQLACTFHPLCTAFTFLSKNNTHDPRFTCYLKTNVTNKSSSPISTSGFTLAKNATNLRRCYPKTFTDVNFLGNDYLTLAEDNMASCQDACARSPYCQFFSYNKSTNGPQCFLKFNFTIVSPSAIHLQLGVESGFSQRDCCTGDGCHQGCAGVLIPDMNLEGTLITEFQASDVVKCQLACTENPHCHFFTFSTNNWSVNNFSAGLIRDQRSSVQNVCSQRLGWHLLTVAQ